MSHDHDSDWGKNALHKTPPPDVKHSTRYGEVGVALVLAAIVTVIGLAGWGFWRLITGVPT